MKNKSTNGRSIPLELATADDMILELKKRGLNFLYVQDGFQSNIENQGFSTTKIYFSGNMFSALGLSGEAIDLILVKLIEDGITNNITNTLAAIMLLLENIVGITGPTMENMGEEE